MKKPYGYNSQSGKLERAMEINSDGKSDWKTIKELEKIIGFNLNGNGAWLLSRSKGIGKIFNIQKRTEPGSNKIHSIKATGFAKKITCANASNLTVEKIRDMPCSMCGTTYNIQIDHRDPRLNYDGYLSIDYFQPLCAHCNDVKRQFCKKCIKTNERFDAKLLGFSISYIEGDKNYDENGLRCKGCFWEGPKEFRSNKLILKKHKHPYKEIDSIIRW